MGGYTVDWRNTVDGRGYGNWEADTDCRGRGGGCSGLEGEKGGS